MTSTVHDDDVSVADVGSRAVRTARRAPVSVVAVDEPELILHGLKVVLTPFPSQVRLVGAGTGHMATEADVVLFDCFPGTTPGGALTGRLPERLSGPIVGYSWHTQPAHIDWALNHGFAGYLSKALSGSELVRALEAVREGETVIRVDAARLARTSTALRGLTPREREVLTHVCAGLRNAEIAQQLNISPNSLKSYIRSAYRRIDVTTRSQAVLWGISHGLETR